MTGIDHMGDIVSLLGSGDEFGCQFTYKVQDNAGGIAQALLLAENFANESPICVILGDNIFQASLKNPIKQFKNTGALLCLKEVPDPDRFGVATLEDDKIIAIHENRKSSFK